MEADEEIEHGGEEPLDGLNISAQLFHPFEKLSPRPPIRLLGFFTTGERQLLQNDAHTFNVFIKRLICFQLRHPGFDHTVKIVGHLLHCIDLGRIFRGRAAKLLVQLLDLSLELLFHVLCHRGKQSPRMPSSYMGLLYTISAKKAS